MKPKPERSIILRPDVRIETSGGVKNRIVAAMIDETLSLARREVRFKIGAYEWCEPDYQQIIAWAKELCIKPEEVMHRLLDGKSKGEVLWCDPEWNKTVFADGKLLGLNWNFDLLPIENFEWVDGLSITHLGFSSSSERRQLSVHLPSLTHLYCDYLGLLELDLSSMPKLTSLDCSDNHLTRLDISCVPRLTHLACHVNPITNLDLSNVPTLISLGLEANQLAELDLSLVPNLKCLHCQANQLTELDLSKVPMLATLWCHMNKITKLKFSTMPMLTEIDCWVNELTELDLTNTPMLTSLDCGTNKLTELNISALYHLKKLRWDADSTPLIKRPNQDIPPANE